MRTKSSINQTKSVILDQKFWSDFAEKFWEKKPLVLKNVKSPLLQLGDAKIFDLLVLYADRCRKNNDPEGFKFYIDGQKVYAEEVLQVLPVKNDKSLLGYHARMQAMFSDYCLVCDELLKSNLENQALLTDFTNELYSHVGFPNRFSEMGLYLGNYRKTPFGVHVDSCGVFSIPVTGTKKFRLWTPEYVKKNPSLDRTFKYEKHKKSSLLMEVTAGDLTYWPSSAWHIAESDGSFSATWSLGVWVDKPHSETLLEALKPLMDLKLGTSGTQTTTSYQSLSESSGEVRTLPDTYSESIAMLRSLSEAELKDTMLKSWMVHISQQGFKNIPQFEVKLNPNSRIALQNPRALILWQQSQMDKAKIFVSFGGRLIESKKNSDVLKLIKDLNSGKTCLIKDYLNTAKTKKQDLSALETIAAAGALKLI